MATIDEANIGTTILTMKKAGDRPGLRPLRVELAPGYMREEVWRQLAIELLTKREEEKRSKETLHVP